MSDQSTSNQTEIVATAPPAEEPQHTRRQRSGSGQNRSALWALIGVLVGFGLPIFGCVGTLALLASVGSLGGMSTTALESPQGSTPQLIQGAATGPAIGRIEVNGPIVTEGAGAFAATASAVADEIINAIETTAADEEVEVILVHVNTPGGSVVASDRIHHALEQVAQPVVVLMGETAASGGYYISAGAEHIMANPNTFTGSIGVILQAPNVEELADRFGYRQVVFKSGDNKDLLNPYREVSEEETQILQSIIDETYENFLAVILAGRDIEEADLRALADGRIFTGEQALAVDLVDSLGYEEDAVAVAAELGGIDVEEGEEPRVIQYRRAAGFEDLFGAFPGLRALNRLDALSEGELSTTPSLEYRWIP